jgi:hypothetical protein
MVVPQKLQQREHIVGDVYVDGPKVNWVPPAVFLRIVPSKQEIGDTPG